MRPNLSNLSPDSYIKFSREELHDALVEVLRDNVVDRTPKVLSLIKQLTECAEFATSGNEEDIKITKEAGKMTGRSTTGTFKDLPCQVNFCENDKWVFILPSGWGAPRFVLSSSVTISGNR